jgi:hypothetical protein
LVISGAGSVVRSLVVNDFPGNGIAISGARVAVEGCFIGTNAAGTAAESNDQNGVLILGSASKVRIGGLTPAAKNVLSGNAEAGVAILGELAVSNKVMGNFIGTDVTGSTAVANATGVFVGEAATANIIGGTVAKARNLISGNTGSGVEITGEGTSHNKLQGNFIGTNAAGTSKIANAGAGVAVRDGATFNEIGSAVRGGGNVISGNTLDGVRIFGAGSESNLVQGNFIGTDVTGALSLSNTLNGVRLFAGASDNLVGGTKTLARNVVSGNGSRGVQIDGAGSNHNFVQGNYIGTNAAGTAALPNSDIGVIVFATLDNLIGGAVAGAVNVFSGNARHGITLVDTGNAGTTVQGNIIGLNAAGTAPVPNGDSGIRIGQGAGDAIIGGTTAMARNIISGNAKAGITIENALGANCIIQGNFIGTTKDGKTDAGNALHGIVLFAGAKNNTIGGTAKGAGNVIAHNGSDGILIGADAANGFGSDGGAGNSILGNRFFGNGGQAIDLGPNDGATANDLNDPDTGPNNLQNKPILAAAVLTGNLVTVKGTMNTNSSAVLRIEFFANPAGEDEGQIYLGASTLVLTGNSLTFFKTFILTAGLGAGDNITATVTDVNGNTSEFSTAFTIT